jgi:hypothetical protein
MKNIIMITLITMVALFIGINTNYSFANKMDKDNYANTFDDMKDQETSDVNQDNYQNNHCQDSANCINESVSNIFVCEEKSLCLIQYEGPFELLNPY